MKCMLLLLAAGIAAGSISSYKENKEYQYIYESQVVTGVPHYAVEYAGIKIKTKVNVQFKTDGTRATLQMKDIMIHKVMTTMTEEWPASGLLPEDKLTSMEPTVLEELTTELSKPFKFTYENGRVENLKMDPTEATWSVNIKKGLVSLFQVNLNRENEYHDENEAVWTEDTGKIYKVMEADVSGVCETVYGVIEEGQDTMIVNKIKNYDHCKIMPVYEQGIISGLTILPEALESRDVVEKSTHADYKITGTYTDFTIKTVRQDSKYIFSPLSQTSGSAVTTMVQLLTLVDTTPISLEIQPENTLHTREGGLVYELPKTVFGRHREYVMELDSPYRRDRRMSQEEKLSEIDSMLEEMVTLIHPVLKDTAVEKVQYVTSMLYTLTIEDMIKLCERYTTPSENEETTPELTKKGEILLDLIPTLNTPKTVKVVAHLIRNRRISTARAVISLKAIAMTVTPDLELISFLLPTNRDFMAHPVIMNNKMLKHTTLLTIPAIINRLVKQAINEGVPTEQITAHLTTFTKELVTTYSTAETMGDKMAVLKGICNTGLPTMIPFIAEIILDKSETPTIRMIAVQGFNKMPKTFSPRIQKILASCYMDLTEDTGIRKSAFIALIDERPTSAVLNLVTRVQRKEKSIQVGSFVYSYLTTIARAELPGLRTMAENIRRILPLIKPVAADSLTTAKAVHLDYFLKDTNVGAGLQMMKMDTTQEASVVITRLMVHILGKTVTPVQTAFYQSGLKSVFSKIFGERMSLRNTPWGEEPMSDIIKHLMTPLTRGHVDFGSIADELTSIIEKLGITDRTALNRMNMAFNVKLFGEDMSLIDVTADDVLGWVATGYMPLVGKVSDLIEELTTTGKNIDIMKVINLGTSTYQIPTPVGLPLSVNMTATAITHTTGKITTNVPSLSEMIQYGWSGRVPTEMGVMATLKPSVTYEWRATFGVDCGVVTTAVTVVGKCTANTPITINAQVNTETGKISTTFKQPDDAPVHMFKATIEPMVTIVTRDATRMTNPWTLEKITLTHPSRVELVTVTVPTEMTTLNAKVTYSRVMPIAVPSWMPIPRLWAPSEMEVTVKAINPSTPVTVLVEYKTATNEEVQNILPNGAELHRMMNYPRAVTAKISFGPQHSEEDQVRCTISAVTNEYMTKYQVITATEVPTLTRTTLKTDVTINIEALVPRKLKEMDPTTPVCEIKASFGTTNMELTIFPDKDEFRTSKLYEHNNFLRMIEQLTEEKVTSTVVKSVSEKPPTLNYKMKMDTNIDMSDMTVMEEMLPVIVATAAYTKLAFPMIPTSYCRTIENAPTGIEGQLTIIPEYQKVVVVVRTPNAMEYAVNVPVYLYTPISKLITVETPVTIGSYSPESFFTPTGNFLYHLAGKCSVHHAARDEDMISTFDALTYSMPRLPNTCEVLLAKDCSGLDLYTVLMTPVEDSKVLKVYIPRHKVELVPAESWRSSSTVKVFVDGEEVTVREDEFKTLTEESVVTPKFGEITKKGDWTMVYLIKYGLLVATDGKEVVIHTTPFMSQKVCGLCGNYDGERNNDFEGPDMSIYPRSEIMISKYVVNSDSCSARSVRSHYGIREISAESCRIQHLNKVIENNKGETCFSIGPVPVCPRDCRHSGNMSRREMSFYCRSSNNVNTRRLLEKSREHVLDELEFKRVDDVLTIDIPRECEPRY